MRNAHSGPRPDGATARRSPAWWAFFGSPTKLFEYMASGRAIRASDLDQIAEVLEHERTALLVPPGDIAAWTAGLARLAGDPVLRARLGEAAREDALRRHTWTAHVDRILDRLARPPVGGSPSPEGSTTPGQAGGRD